MKRLFIYFSGCLGDMRGIGLQPFPSSDSPQIALWPLTFKKATGQLLERTRRFYTRAPFVTCCGSKARWRKSCSSWTGNRKAYQQGESGEEGGLMTPWEAQGWQGNGCWGGANSLRNPQQKFRGCMVDPVLGEASCRNFCLDVVRDWKS